MGALDLFAHLARRGEPRRLRDLGREIEREIDREIREEIEHHLAEATEEALARGLSPDEARAEALRRFGDVERTARACRRVQLGERIMLQRILIALVILLGASTSYLWWRGSTALLQAREAQQVARAEAEAARARAAEADARAQESAALPSPDALDALAPGTLRAAAFWNESERAAVWTVGTRAVTSDEDLRARFADWREECRRRGEPSPGLMIDADERLPWKHLAAAVDLAQEAGSEQISFATSSER